MEMTVRFDLCSTFGILTGVIQFAIVILLFAGTQQDQVTIEAPKQERNQNISHITGPFVITYQDIRVEGDTATYDHSTKQVTAAVRLNFTRAAQNLQSANITLSLDTTA